MATASQVHAPSAAQPTTKTGYPEGSLRFDWAMTGLSAIYLAGLWVDGWAHFHGEVDDSFFTPWHFLFYSAFGLVALFIGFHQVRNINRGYAFTRALPKGYWLSLIGVAVFALGGVGDMLWHTLFGIEAGTEALLSPSHIMLAIGMALIFTGPVRAAWVRAREATNEIRGWHALGPMIVSMTLFLTLIMFFTSYAHPVVYPYVLTNITPTGQTEQTWQLYVMNADGTQQIRLTNNPDINTSYSAWSPDGTRIAYNVSVPPDEDAGIEESSQLFVMDADGSNIQQVGRDPGIAYAPVWSPDGAKLGYVSYRNDNADLYVIDLATGEEQRLTDTPGHEFIMSWSPDGSQIAYSLDEDGPNLWVMNADGTDPRQLTTNNNSLAPRWSPDGTRILFSGFFDNSMGIYTINAADGSDLQRVINTGDFEADPAYSPDGSAVIFAVWRGDSAELYRVPVSGVGDLTAATNLTNNPALAEGYPSYSPDGSQILFNAIGGGAGVGSDNPLLVQDMGVTSILYQAFVLAGVVALLAWRWQLPFGAFTVMFTLSTALLTLLTDLYMFIPAALIAGLIADLLVIGLKPSPQRVGRFIAFAFLTPMIYYALYFVTVQLLGGISWSIHVWTGAIFLTGVVGGLVALMISASTRLDRVVATS